MEDLVDTVIRQAPDAHVHVVRLRIGHDACVSRDALRFCFDVCARGTALERAALEIIDGRGDELALQEIEVS